MSSYKPYGKYKDSGVEWLGQIPSHWQLRRLKYVFKIQKRIAGELGHDVLSITQRGIKIKDIESGGGQLAQDYSKYQLVYAGEFAMNHMDLITGYVDLSKFKGVISPDYRVFTLLHEDSDKRYLLKILQHCYHQKIFYSFGQGVSLFGRWRLSAESFNNFVFPIPPSEEQTAIARFLDYKTEQIDRFIRKKKQLIKLLNEQKAAIINQAVTKGINPDAPMKDSGIEWLGEIPAHWEVRKLKYLTTYFKGYAFNSSEFSDEGIPIVKVSNIKDLSIKMLNTYIKHCNQKIAYEGVKLKYGDIIVTTVGSKPEIHNSAVGQVGYVDSQFEGAYLNQNTVCLRPNKKILHEEYVKYFFANKYMRGIFDSISLCIVNQAYLIVDKILNIKITFPSKAEQIDVINFINEETNILNITISTIEKEIALAEEYQTALIAEAVTGKIDVREYKIPDTINSEEQYEDIEEELSIAAEDEVEYEIQENE